VPEDEITNNPFISIGDISAILDKNKEPEISFKKK